MFAMMDRFFIVSDQDPIGDFQVYFHFYGYLLLNSFPQSLTKMAGHYCSSECFMKPGKFQNTLAV